MNTGSTLLFLEAEDIIDIHDSILETEKGLKGMNPGKVEAIVGRVKNIYSYGEDGNDITTAFELAAHYAVAIARGHSFNDGNKRTAFVTMISILEVNNIPLPEDLTQALIDNMGNYADIMVDVADGSVDAKRLAEIISGVYLIGLTGVGLVKLISFIAQKWGS
ncbi:type II toxin-antitoxin system death-on-curing family toxin [Vibrio sp. OPT18]|uniref:type II toxin-antitoxin system death-on-curing family toxin n=1 Tax=Vibrio sp. OPT18 TaxID=2778641 RepID=UPI001880A5CF|nr:type II toxin-antitoxin system death-on-curing family toxin [Vibrio sp. OPT18]MBE8578668.1 type II toxin-antitoxin system death-on-curing family toxin [Vibrio sp. OPT18]